MEAAVSKMGLRAPALTAAQRATTPVRVVSTAGAAVGVVVGCLIGMTSLLFMDLDKADRLKREGACGAAAVRAVLCCAFTHPLSCRGAGHDL